MVKLFDRVKVNIATTGVGDVTFGAATSDAFLTPSEAGCADADTVRYVIVDGTDYEEGVGTITNTVSEMERTTVTRSKIGGSVGTTKINLSGTAVLALIASAADILTPDDNLASLDDADTALTNLGGTTVGQALFTAVDEYGARLKLSVLSMPQGRLTLASGVPVMTTAQTDKTTIYYTPFVGNQIPVKDPSLGVMGMATFSELSTTTTNTTNNPAAIGASKVNDWFVWRDGSTMRLCHGPDWTNDSTRSAGTALTMANGVLVNNADITNGPLAGYGTYVGTTRSDVSSKLNWRYGTTGTAALKFADFSVWNAYNRRDVTDWFDDTTSSYTYSGTVRLAHGSANYSVYFVIGLVEDAIEGGYACYAGQAANPVGAIGLGLNTTTAFSAPPCSVPAFNDTRMSTIRAMPQLGYNQLSALEASGSGQTLTVQSAGSSNYVGGLNFRGCA